MPLTLPHFGRALAGCSLPMFAAAGGADWAVEHPEKQVRVMRPSGARPLTP